MHARLIGYLQDNRDQIIESWLTDVDVPAPVPTTQIGQSDREEGAVPYSFFSHAFDGVIRIIETGDSAPAQEERPQLQTFIDETCSCRSKHFQGRVCLELLDSGLAAFASVLSGEWDTSNEFSSSERERATDDIHHALSGFFAHEIDACPCRKKRNDCPFSDQQT